LIVVGVAFVFDFIGSKPIGSLIVCGLRAGFVLHRILLSSCVFSSVLLLHRRHAADRFFKPFGMQHAAEVFFVVVAINSSVGLTVGSRVGAE